MALGDQRFQVIELAQRNGQREYHGEAGVNGAGHKVRRENGGVPTGQHGHGKVEADDRVHRKHQRSS